MRTVHHDTAMAFLVDVKKSGKGSDGLRDAINAAFPGWGNNADKLTGYNTPHHHVSLIVSRCLHDTLPVGRTEYAAHYMHGFNDVMKFLDFGKVSAKDSAAWLADAIANLNKVMAD